MVEPTLQLALHEMAPGQSKMYGRPFTFRTVWEGRERDFVGLETRAELGELIFFCFADEPERGNFVSAWTPPHRSEHLPKPLAFEPRFLSPRSDAATKLRLECASSWGRVFFLDDNLNIAAPHQGKRRLFLSQDGGGEWRHWEFFPLTGSYFVWADRDDAHQWASRPPLELLNHFLTKANQSGSDAALALQWDDLPHGERDLRCRPVARGSYAEFEHILYLFAQSRVEPWQEEFDTQIASIPLVVSVLRAKTYINGREVMEKPFAIRFERFCSWLLHYFEPPLDVEYIRQCTAAKHWSQRATQISAQVETPTQHERLEATFQLREWLADKATPAEIELLLRED